jgi:chromosome segregation ATPase
MDKNLMDIVANLTTMNKSLEEENNKLKEERENASYELAGELEDINTRWAEDKEADRIVIDGLKSQIDSVKAKLDDVKEENKDIEEQLVSALISVARLEDIVEVLENIEIKETKKSSH